jgi:hypothetical protein
MALAQLFFWVSRYRLPEDPAPHILFPREKTPGAF